MMTSQLTDLNRPTDFQMTKPEETAESRDQELRETCAKFEGMFLELMMKTMREASDESSFIKKSNGEKVFTEMLDQQYVDLTAANPSSGLGDTLYNYIKQTSPEYQDRGNLFPMQDSGVSSSTLLELNSLR